MILGTKIPTGGAVSNEKIYRIFVKVFRVVGLRHIPIQMTLFT